MVVAYSLLTVAVHFIGHVGAEVEQASTSGTSDESREFSRKRPRKDTTAGCIV